MEACYGGTDVMERSCAVARGIDINSAGINIIQYGYCTRFPISKCRYYNYNKVLYP